MTRKCHTHTLQANPRQREQETHNINNRMTTRRQLSKATGSLVISDVKYVEYLHNKTRPTRPTKIPKTMGAAQT